MTSTTTHTSTTADLYLARLSELLNDAAESAAGTAASRREKLAEIAGKATEAEYALSPFDDDAIPEYRVAAEVEAVLADLAHYVETGQPRRAEEREEPSSMEERLDHVRKVYEQDLRLALDSAADGRYSGFGGEVAARAVATVLVAIRKADERAFSTAVREILAEDGDPLLRWQNLTARRRLLQGSLQRARSKSRVEEIQAEIATVDSATENAKRNLDDARAEVEASVLSAIGGRVV